MINYTVLKIFKLGLVMQSKPTIRAYSEKAPVPEGTNQSSDLKALHKVNNLERRFLVWTKKYKSIEEVPNFVGQTIMERARNRMRIRIANYMMAATFLGCILMVYLGKQDQKEGKSVAKMNMEWHRQIKEEDDRKKAAEAQKKK